MSNDLGLDRSGNGNNWTVNNITYADQMLDSPTNNFPTWNPLSSIVLPTLSEGNLKNGGENNKAMAGTFGVSTGKWYWEINVLNNSQVAPYIGVTKFSMENDPDASPNLSSTSGRSVYRFKSTPTYKNFTATSYADDSAHGLANYGILGLALDLDNGTLKYYVNNTLYHTDSTIPSDGTTIYPFLTGTYAGGSGWNSAVSNFGQDSSFAGNKTAQGNQDGNSIGDFYYTPPNLFLSLCTSNLLDVDVVPSKNFNTVAYTGTGSNQVVTGVGFQPDFLWLKNRSLGYGHKLFDVLRGLGSANPGSLSSNASDAEGTFNYINAVSNDGFTTVSQQYSTNNPGSAIVAWNWKANGSGSSNTAGSINSTVSVNNDAGFSIVSYTGNGTAGATVGHGLSKAPEMWIIKNRDASGDWVVWHKDLGNQTKNLYLDVDAAVQTEPPPPGIATIPSNTLVSLGTFTSYNANTQKMIMYAFHSVDGYSKIATYTGNGSADGPFVFTGFRPAFVMTKSTAAGDWTLHDSVRDINNPLFNELNANTVGAENTGDADMDFTSNGFKIRRASGQFNANNATVTYLAFAETPFKYSNAR